MSSVKSRCKHNGKKNGTGFGAVCRRQSSFYSAVHHEHLAPLHPSEVAAGETAKVWKDANGNVLQDGDTVTLVKDLKIKGSSSVVKVGTKVKNIRLIEGDHDIDCKVDGFGPMQLKTEFVKKA
jgi:protein PhnA